MRSISLGSSLAAIETAGRQQSAAATHRINLRIITPLRAEDRREILVCKAMFSDHNRPSTHLKNLIFIGHHRWPPVSGLLGVPCCVTVPWKLPFGPGRQSECDADLDEGVDFVSAGHF